MLAIGAGVSTNHRKWLTTGFKNPVVNFFTIGGQEEQKMNIYLEIFGYIGTALVLISMMMTSVEKLRWFNLAGSVVSMIYAFLCNTFPVVFLNLGLSIINIVQLVRLHKEKKNEEEMI